MAQNSTKQSWLRWLEQYGVDRFFDSFIHTVEGAQSICVHCGEVIQVDITIGGGVPDWSTLDGDFGCSANPKSNEDGVWGHVARGTISKG